MKSNLSEFRTISVYRLFWLLAACLGCGFLAPVTSVQAGGVIALTTPQGYIRVNIPAGSIAAPSMTTFSLPLSGSVPATFVGESTGQITGVTSSTLINNAAGWGAGALSVPAAPYFIRITSGLAAGQTFQISTTTPNSPTAVTVLNQTLDLTTLGIATGTNGDTYQIIPGDTLFSLFGTMTLGATAAAAADMVEITVGRAWNDYYYNSGTGHWQLGSVPVNQNNVVLRPDSGITFYRRGSTALSFALSGAVPTTNSQIVVNNTGGTYVGNVFPIDQTLQAAAYGSIPGWVNNTGSVSSASNITVWNGSVSTPYNYMASAGQWRAGSVPVNENSVIISAGTPVIVQQPSSNTGVSVFTEVLPYSVN